MVHIVPSISFVKTLIVEIEQGHSFVLAVQNSCEQESTPLSGEIYLWNLQYQQNGESKAWTPKTHFQWSLQELLKQGLNGSPIYEALKGLEQEMMDEFEVQWKAYLESLPMKLSIPMLFLFFPAYLVLLFGPLITKFIMEVH